MMKIGMLTSGGDCQALNAAMRGVVKGLTTRICLMAAIAGAALTALGVAWASVSSGTVQTQEGARSDLDAKIISTVPHEGRRTARSK